MTAALAYLAKRARPLAAGLILLALVAAAFLAYRYAHRPHAVENGTFAHGSITLMTVPVPVLPPHAHYENSMQVDSVLDPGHGVFVHSDTYTVPEDLWVTGITFTAENAPRSIVHHLLLVRRNVRNAECPDRMQELFAIGLDTAGSVSFPAPYGILLHKGDRLYLNGMLHNPLPPEGAGGTYQDIRIGFVMNVETPSASRTRNLEYHRIVLDDADCQNPGYTPDNEADVFTVPADAKAFVIRSKDEAGVNPTRFVFPASGILYGFSGHIHEFDGGKELDVYLNGSLIERFVAKFFGPDTWDWGKVATMPWQPTHVKAGDVITLRAVYDNAHPFPIRDAMAQSGLYFSPDLATTTPGR